MADGTAPVIVTGAAGFIGSCVVEALLSRSRRVVGLDNFDPFYARARKEANLRECAARAGRGAFEFVECDIREAAPVFALFDRVRPEGVVHIAAKAGVRPSIADPVGYTRANVEGAAIVFEAARRASCSRIVAASSSSVYGNSRRAPLSESDPARKDRGKPPRSHKSSYRSGRISDRSKPPISMCRTRPARLSDTPRMRRGSTLPRMRNLAGARGRSASTRRISKRAGMR